MDAKEQARLEPSQELKAAVADLQQHNPILKVPTLMGHAVWILWFEASPTLHRAGQKSIWPAQAVMSD